jgi:hypothetical protein
MTPERGFQFIDKAELDAFPQVHVDPLKAVITCASVVINFAVKVQWVQEFLDARLHPKQSLYVFSDWENLGCQSKLHTEKRPCLHHYLFSILYA